jgi:predicted dehydrogenase
MKTQIIGAGSAGVHLSRACHKLGHETIVYDNDTSAFGRFWNLYRERYLEDYTGYWLSSDMKIDFHIVATPPDTHFEIVEQIRKECGDVPILVEKPICLPAQLDLMQKVEVNYNHLYQPSFTQFMFMNHFALEDKKPDRIEVRWQESVDYILKAHPWIPDISKSYLGDYKRGGGSAYEHSHGLACALALFKDLKREEVTDLQVEKTYNGDYDDRMKMTFNCRGVALSVATDFTSTDVKKSILMIQDEHFVHLDFAGDEDVLTWERNGGSGKRGFPRTREDQFVNGLRGALKPTLDTYSIGKLAVQLIGECHEL